MSNLFKNNLMMILHAIIVGILVGFSSILYRHIIAFFHHLFFSGQINFSYNETLHTSPSIWGLGVIFVPVIGGLIVIWLGKHFGRNQRGLSVSELMYKMHSKDAKINPLVALTGTFSSTISLGSGASVGREGPMVQLGAAMSSFLGDRFQLERENRKLLIAIGAAAGTAAIFHAPLTGIAFAAEILLINIDFFSIFAIAIGVFTATVIEYFALGFSPIFSLKIPDLSTYHHEVAHYFLLIIFGIVSGVLSVLLIHGVYWFDKFFRYFFKNDYVQHIIGMLAIGVLMYLLMYFFGEYYIEGIGFATIQDCLNLVIANPWLLLLLVICKLFATCASLGSGASGGIFSPALFMGATFGAFFSLTMNYFFPELGISHIIFVMAGMAAVLGSTTGAIVTAVVLTAEMTQTLNFILPMSFSVVIAFFIRKLLCEESVYTLKLVLRGVKLKGMS